MHELFFEIHSGLEREGPGTDRDTRRAFRMLPPLRAPHILDVGCGPGGQTLELARLFDAQITAMDTHQPYLDRLQRQAEGLGFAERIRIVNRSMLEMGFADQTFDLIWCEGAIYIAGFERGLREWRRLLRPGGFMAVTDAVWLRTDVPEEVRRFWDEGYPDMLTVDEAAAVISACGYQLVGHFTLPEESWWVHYYRPIEEKIGRLRERYAGDDEALAVLEGERLEIELYRRYADCYGYEFFVIRRDQ